MLGGGLLVVAVAVLHHQFARVPVDHILGELRALPPERLAASLIFTALGYLMMTGYDYLACRAVERRLPWRRVALVSFTAYAASINLGMALLSGGGVRFRLYSIYGLAAVEIAQIVAYTGLLFLLGLLAIGGTALLLAPMELLPNLPLSATALRLLGGGLLAALIGLHLARMRGGDRIRLGRFGELRLASPLLMALMTLVSSLDWTFSAAALFVLLPSSPPFLLFLAMFFLGQLLGIASHVPGGLGVFETTLALQLAPFCPASAVLGALIAYRGIYFLLPLLAAGGLFAAQEIRLGTGWRPDREPRADGANASVMPGDFPGAGTVGSLFPRMAAVLAFACGGLLLFGGLTPDAAERLESAARFLPLQVMEASHFVSVLAGMGLILLARGLSDRLRAAWGTGTGLLTAGAILTWTRGGHGGIGLVLLIVALLLLLRRCDFPLRSSLFTEVFSPAWAAAAAAALLASLWIGFLAYRAAPYAPDLWGRFELLNGASRYLRAGLGAALLLLFAAGWCLFRASPRLPDPPTKEEAARLEELIGTSENPDAHLAFLPEKRFLWDASGGCAWMFGVQGRTWIFLEDPLGPRELWPDLMGRSLDAAAAAGARPFLYGIGEAMLPLALERGLLPYKIGEEGLVDLPSFSLEGSERRGLRKVLVRREREGTTFEVIPPDAAIPLFPELRDISDAWLEERGGKEKGFVMGSFDRAYLSRFPFALVRAEGRIVAFSNLMDGAGVELSPDLMRHLPDAPRETMEYLFLKMILWARGRGYRRFRLGSVPLSGIEPGPFTPLPARAMALIYEHGERFYPFRGLRAFKEKFGPRWRSRFVAVPGPLHLAPALADTTRLIAASGFGAQAP
jgi:phosphatidylglycerol lysyltransferase